MPTLKVYVTKDQQGRIMKKVPQSRIAGFGVWHLADPTNAEQYDSYVKRIKTMSNCKVVEVPYAGQTVGEE